MADRASTNRMRDCKCPFVQRIEGKRIECEGPADNVVVGLRFRTARAAEKHLCNYCEKNFRYCEIYRMVMAAKYEE